MNKALEALFDDIRALPQAAQDEIAAVIEGMLAQDADDPETLEAKRRAVEEGQADIAAGRVDTWEDVQGLLERLRSA